MSRKDRVRGIRQEDSEDNVTGGGQRSRAVCPTLPIQLVAKFAAFWTGERLFAVGVGPCVAQTQCARMRRHSGTRRRLENSAHYLLPSGLLQRVIQKTASGSASPGTQTSLGCQPRNPLALPVQTWSAFVCSACVIANGVGRVVKERRSKMECTFHV